MWCHTLHCLNLLLIPLDYMAANIYSPHNATHRTVSFCCYYYWTPRLLIFTSQAEGDSGQSLKLQNITPQKQATFSFDLNKYEWFRIISFSFYCSIYSLIQTHSWSVSCTKWNRTSHRATLKNTFRRRPLLHRTAYIIFTWNKLNCDIWF